MVWVRLAIAAVGLVCPDVEGSSGAGPGLVL